MRILVVNPNTTRSMTEKIGAAARAVAAPATEITAVSPAMGPASIEGYYDEAFAVPGLLEEVRKGEAAGCDGYVVACFDDTGVDAARCVARGPVLGIAEAAMHVATMIAGSFTIVSTLGRSAPALEHLVHKYGFARRCRRVRTAEVPVLALEEPGSGAVDRLRAEIARAVAEDRCEAIVLGCAGMADLNARLAAEFGLPVIDGVAAAVKLVEAVVGLGLGTSKALRLCAAPAESVCWGDGAVRPLGRRAMPAASGPEAAETRYDFYGPHYRRFGSELAARIRREVYGEDLGQTGWRTAAEQRRIAELLGLAGRRRSAGHRLRLGRAVAGPGGEHRLPRGRAGHRAHGRRPRAGRGRGARAWRTAPSSKSPIAAAGCRSPTAPSPRCCAPMPSPACPTASALLREWARALRPGGQAAVHRRAGRSPARSPSRNSTCGPRRAST